MSHSIRKQHFVSVDVNTAKMTKILKQWTLLDPPKALPTHCFTNPAGPTMPSRMARHRFASCKVGGGCETSKQGKKEKNKENNADQLGLFLSLLCCFLCFLLLFLHGFL